MRKVLLLGASGSIGTQSLDLFEQHPDDFQLLGISVGHQIDKIPGILHRFPSLQKVAVLEPDDAKKIRDDYPLLQVYEGEEGILELIQESEADMVENAILGFAGLLPSLTTLRANKILCLANKESLVVGGELMERLLSHGQGKLYPIDSEHVALAKCLSQVNRKDVDRLVITASGGAFRKKSRSELLHVTPEEALHHPTWSMGKKITIDSATMFNKGFEVIEAHYLFHWPVDRIEILMHDESYVHSLIKMKDGSYYADIAKPDMHGPIAYALYEGKASFNVYHEEKLSDFGPYTFHKFRPERYPAVGIALRALAAGGVMPAYLNGANEAAVSLFLNHRIPFLAIEKAVSGALSSLPNVFHPTLRDIQSADFYARLWVERHYGGEH